jgi:hypothetical protein
MRSQLAHDHREISVTLGHKLINGIPIVCEQ